MVNSYEIRGDITAIYIDLKNGTRLETLIETVDLPLVQTFSGTWYSHKGYVIGEKTRVNKRRVKLILHRLIMGFPDGLVVDHINHDKVDNRRSNLRILTIGQNLQNRSGPTVKNRSGHRGVTWSKRYNKWAVQVRVYGKLTTLGFYTDLNQAAKVSMDARAEMMPYSLEALKRYGL